MTDSSLDLFTKRVRDSWGPLTSGLVADCRRGLAELLRAPSNDQWLVDFREELPESRELYRDPVHGFVLLAHTEALGRYRAPHNHGSSWVIYGVLHGEIEMGAYTHVEASTGISPIVGQESKLVRPGDVRVYLPGDIHDTRCVNGPAILLRFTASDLEHETNIISYSDVGGVWMPRNRDA